MLATSEEDASSNHAENFLRDAFRDRYQALRPCNLGVPVEGRSLEWFSMETILAGGITLHLIQD